MLKKIKDTIWVRKIWFYIKKIKMLFVNEEKYESNIFLKRIGKTPNFRNPQSLNEKIAWLKIHYLQDYYKMACDKYLVHEYLKKKLGKDYAPDLIFCTKDAKELNYANITEFPCIIKVSNGCGANLILNSPNEYSEKYLQDFFEKQVWISNANVLSSFEHQYLTHNPYIVVEKLLVDEKGNIPNDYKFLYINGQLEFVYCSVDRKGQNVRQIYDGNWDRLPFVWIVDADEKLFEHHNSSVSIQKPLHYEEMLNISQILAQDFPLVRVDFYVLKERIYVGEITLHHGSGHDRFYPEKYDMYYGEKLNLPEKNR